MGADAFVVFYGVRETVPADDHSQLDQLESGSHPVLRSANAANLQTWWGRLTEGSDYHILIGRKVGVFGVENDHDSSLEIGAIKEVAEQVASRIKASGISGSPSLHFQLEAQY